MLSAHEAVVRESGQGSRLDRVTHFLGIKKDSQGQEYFDGKNGLGNQHLRMQS